jgi:hypothetical protein
MTLAAWLRSFLFDRFPADADFRDTGTNRVRVSWTVRVDGGTRQNSPYIISIAPVVRALWETSEAGEQREIAERIAQLVDARWVSYDPLRRQVDIEQFVVAIDSGDFRQSLQSTRPE